jgi:hypothetical protein
LAFSKQLNQNGGLLEKMEKKTVFAIRFNCFDPCLEGIPNASDKSFVSNESLNKNLMIKNE